PPRRSPPPGTSRPPRLSLPKTSAPPSALGPAVSPARQKFRHFIGPAHAVRHASNTRSLPRALSSAPRAHPRPPPLRPPPARPPAPADPALRLDVPRSLAEDWPSPIQAVSGDSIDIRVVLSYSGSAAIGFGSFVFQPTLSNWAAGDAMGPLVNNGVGGQVT